MRIKGRIGKSINCKLKPYEFPDGFQLIIDTREQRPLFIPKPPKGLILIRDTLENGDYSIKGLEKKVMIERKGLSDLVNYIGNDRKNTKIKLKRAERYQWKGLVIEGSELELLRPQMFSRINPESIRQSLVSFEVKYGLHIYYGNRKNIERWVLDRLLYFYKWVMGNRVKIRRR